MGCHCLLQNLILLISKTEITGVMVSQGYVDLFEEGPIPNTLFPCLGLVEAKIYLLGLLKRIKKRMVYNTDFWIKQIYMTGQTSRQSRTAQSSDTQSSQEAFKRKGRGRGAAPHARSPVSTGHQPVEAVPSSLGRVARRGGYQWQLGNTSC